MLRGVNGILLLVKSAGVLARHKTSKP